VPTQDVSASRSCAMDGASAATGRSSKAREWFDHSGEQRGYTSGGSHSKTQYNVKQPTSSCTIGGVLRIWYHEGDIQF
jgi:hypothetical protein